MEADICTWRDGSTLNFSGTETGEITHPVRSWPPAASCTCPGWRSRNRDCRCETAQTPPCPLVLGTAKRCCACMRSRQAGRGVNSSGIHVNSAHWIWVNTVRLLFLKFMLLETLRKDHLPSLRSWRTPLWLCWEEDRVSPPPGAPRLPCQLSPDGQNHTRQISVCIRDTWWLTLPIQDIDCVEDSFLFIILTRVVVIFKFLK